MENGLSGFFAGIAAFGASLMPGSTPEQAAPAREPEKPAIVQEKVSAGQPRSVALPVAMRLLPPKRPSDVALAAPAPLAAPAQPRRPAGPIAPPAAPTGVPSEARRPTPAADPGAAPGSMVALGSPPLSPSFQLVGQAAAPAARPVVTAAALPMSIAAAPTEPKRVTAAPAQPGAGAPPPTRAGPPDAPRAVAAATAASVAAPAVAPASRAQTRLEPLTDQEIVDRANAFFNNLTTLVADFTQIGGDGRRLSGTLYLQRPGKVRFEYDKPATLEVIADGSSVAVQDSKLATQDLYPISQTPLKFLLRERVNLGQDIRVTGVANEGDSVRVSLEDRSTLGGTSRIALFFDPQLETLTQWRIVDPQGFQTTVMLNKVDRNRRIDQSLFVITVNRAINNDNTSR